MPSVSESFYNYFPSFNPKKQQTLQERRRDYFEYLKKVRNCQEFLMTVSPLMILLTGNSNFPRES